jgi:hypothetical protein
VTSRALLLFCALALGCGATSSEETADDDFTASDYAEDSVLPYKGSWLDAPKALAGVGQFDRLRGTIYDDAKCSTMVAIGAAIVGGEARFVRLLDEAARRREGRRDDLATIDRVRGAVTAHELTPRHLHELTEVLVRTYKVGDGAYDEQIAEMVRASGYEPVRVGSVKPQVLIDSLGEGEVVPVSTVAEGIPHITLAWKDSRGTVRLYDSDDVHGSHVMPRGSAPYRARIDDPLSAWDLREKYR